MARLVIIAFGDSLTVGYHSGHDGDSPEASPYTEVLREKADKVLGRQGTRPFDVTFLNRGTSGELTGEMIERYPSTVIAVEPDAVIVLGGSNDLGWGYHPESIGENLSWMYDEALAHGIRPVACTVPSVLGFDEGIEPRRLLNETIVELSRELGIPCVDLFSATCDSSQRLRAEFSDDGLHLTSAGYRAMGEAIFRDAVGPMIERRLGDVAIDQGTRTSAPQG